MEAARTTNWPARLTPQGLAIIAVLLLVLQGCGGGGGGGGSSNSSTTTTVTASGATVSGPDNVQVVVPAGAVSEDTQVTIRRSSAGAPAAASNTSTDNAIYEFLPHDIVFRKPILIRLPRPAGSTGTAALTSVASAQSVGANARHLVVTGTVQ